MKILNLILLIVLILPVANALTVDSVTQTPSKVIPGQTATIGIEVRNEDSKTIKNIDVKLDLSDPNLPVAPITSSAEKTIDELQEDDTSNLNFNVITLSTAASQIYKIPLIITYQDKDNTKFQKNDFISLIVEAKPNLDISSNNNYVLKGQEQSVLIKVVNSGLAPVKFLSIQLLPSSYYTILSSGTAYLGSIDSDDSDTAEYKIRVDNDAPQNLQLLFTISYRDTSNKLFTDTKYISVNAYTNSEAKQLGLTPSSNLSLVIYIIVGLIVIYIIYRLIRRRKK
ncbi:MAG: hypothetical protein NT139_01635 [Candidatus Woesearchaeota archaeon]|nr:hypothetical protein [Candidatus Woesearchaeota archaeon]